MNSPYRGIICIVQARRASLVLSIYTSNNIPLYAFHNESQHGPATTATRKRTGATKKTTMMKKKREGKRRRRKEQGSFVPRGHCDPRTALLTLTAHIAAPVLLLPRFLSSSVHSSLLSSARRPPLYTRASPRNALCAATPSQGPAWAAEIGLGQLRFPSASGPSTRAHACCPIVRTVHAKRARQLRPPPPNLSPLHSWRSSTLCPRHTSTRCFALLMGSGLLVYRWCANEVFTKITSGDTSKYLMNFKL